MMNSRICELLGIEYPVFQGGMAWVADGKLATAVSEGGGLGIIGAGNAPADFVREQIHNARSLTKKPIGVNLMLMSPFAAEVAKVITEERVEVVTTGAGNPSVYLKDWKAAGIKVIPVVASVAMAKLMTRLGADALIAEGGESGGHVGELTTMVLVPQICDVTNLPVIAAGGIADGRGMAAAIMLGAEGVQMGTRFLSAKECSIHPNYKEKILKAGDLCTMVTGKRLGHPVRSLRRHPSGNGGNLLFRYGGGNETNRCDQPCLFAMELAAAAVLREEGVQPEAVAGFSLGEVTAAAFAGLYDLETGFRLVCRRGELMQQESEKYDTSMAAVLKLSKAQIHALCGRCTDLYPVNFNCPGQIAVSGLRDQMDAFLADVKEAGGRGVPLKVSGAFHSPFMAKASEAFRKELDTVELNAPKIPLYSDLTGEPYTANAAELLSKQICSPVRWEMLIRNLIADGFDTFVEIGPGRTLVNLIRKTDSSVRALTVGEYLEEIHART